MERANAANGKKEIAVCMLIYLIISLCITALGIGILALLLYKLHLPLQVVSVVVIILYILSTGIAGFLAGKKMQVHRFMWGLLMGCAYYLVLLLVSYIYHGEGTVVAQSFLTTFLLCGGGGMLGGMLS
ncbi:MAG: TIGR04086 family membrane protein [Lachnospiraceae bacterium]|nr:TIGR04086 family membrane protein [Lachnospiraceae bacterium]